MKALAEFIMRGRLQASLVALAGNLVPLISPATVGLVTLRGGTANGLLILLWAALPLVAAAMISDASVLIVGSSLAGLLVLMAAANVLKTTVSWQWTLLSVLALCSAAIYGLGLSLSGATADVVEETRAVLDTLGEQDSEEVVSVFYALMAAIAAGLGLETIHANFVLGFLVWLTALHVVGSLLLARWWQALLYNPGGFQTEFHALRLEAPVAAVLVLGILGCTLLAAEYMIWASLLGMPLLLAGLGFIHHAVSFLGLGKVWLVILYVGLVFLGPLSMVLVGVALLDSFLNLRARLEASRKS